MKQIKLFCSIAIASGIILSFSCGHDNEAGPSAGNISDENQMGIILTANTSLRIDPLIVSSRIDQLKKGEVVKVLDISAREQVIAGQKSHWYKVRLTSGITGWVFGSNIKIIKGHDSSDVESYLSSFWGKETEELSTALHGKWWSVNRFGDYTSHCLEIYKDGTYKSYYKGSSKIFEGSYNFDFNKSQVIFLSGTSFEGDLTYVRRGDIFTLYREKENDEIRFKKINLNPQSENEDQATSKPEVDTDSIKKEDEN